MNRVTRQFAFAKLSAEAEPASPSPAPVPPGGAGMPVPALAVAMGRNLQRVRQDALTDVEQLRNQQEMVNREFSPRRTAVQSILPGATLGGAIAAATGGTARRWGAGLAAGAGLGLASGYGTELATRNLINSSLNHRIQGLTEGARAVSIDRDVYGGIDPAAAMTTPVMDTKNADAADRKVQRAHQIAGIHAGMRDGIGTGSILALPSLIFGGRGGQALGAGLIAGGAVLGGVAGNFIGRDQAVRGREEHTSPSPTDPRSYRHTGLSSPGAGRTYAQATAHGPVNVLMQPPRRPPQQPQAPAQQPQAPTQQHPAARQTSFDSTELIGYG